MSKPIHISKTIKNTIIVHVEGTNESTRVQQSSSLFCNLEEILNGAKNYKRIAPESPDYKCVQGIYCKLKWGMHMGYWRNFTKDTTTKMHVIISDRPLCNSPVDDSICLSSGRVIIDYINCSKCLDLYVKTIHDKFKNNPIEELLSKLPELRLGI